MWLIAGGRFRSRGKPLEGEGCGFALTSRLPVVAMTHVWIATVFKYELTPLRLWLSSPADTQCAPLRPGDCNGCSAASPAEGLYRGGADWVSVHPSKKNEQNCLALTPRKKMTPNTRKASEKCQAKLLKSRVNPQEVPGTLKKNDKSTATTGLRRNTTQMKGFSHE